MAHITVSVNHGANFTASSLMAKWARENDCKVFSNRFNTILDLGGCQVKYDHWNIRETASTDFVTLYLTEC